VQSVDARRKGSGALRKVESSELRVESRQKREASSSRLSVAR